MRWHLGRGSVILNGPMRRLAVLTLTFVIALVAGSGAARTVDRVGTDGPDKLVGTRAPDRIGGLGGNDRIGGRGGDDLLSGDLGRDKLYGNPGNDTLLGGAGNDLLRGGLGADVLSCGAGRRDVAFADASDTVGEDCETIRPE